VTEVNAPAQTIYSESYAQDYPALYIEPWARKHELNAANLFAILCGLWKPLPRWLDLACGQAWYFSVLPQQAWMLGLDISPAQLARARARVPSAQFAPRRTHTDQFPARLLRAVDKLLGRSLLLSQ
jgi:hypothetical protein